MQCQACDAFLLQSGGGAAATTCEEQRVYCWELEPLYCARCQEGADALTLMQEYCDPASGLLASAVTEHQLECHEVPAHWQPAMRMDDMIARVLAHPRYRLLEKEVRDELRQIGRFDLRRTTEQNRYARRVYHYLVSCE